MLNRAHCLHRQAEKAARKGRVEEAIGLHKEAADILRDLLQNVIDDKVAESVRLQSELHEKEKVILKQQKKRCQKVYKDLESLKCKMGDRREHKAKHHQQDGGDSSSLQSSIYRKFQQTEVLLDQLKIHDSMSDMGSSGVSYARCGTPPVEDVPVKKPKDDKVIIEELQTANIHLRKMVDSLFMELSSCQEENVRLKARIREMEGQSFSSEGSSSVPKSGSGRLRSQNQSGDVYLQPKERAVQSIISNEDLPPLPPLDMPTFNFGHPEQ